MQTITFTCETITPMFLAGADGTTPELRAPSIKGALRFWWRAMNGGNPNMKEDEATIFGSTSQRSKVIINIDYEKSNLLYVKNPFPNVEKHKSYPNPSRPRPKPTEFPVNPLHYLAFGVVQYDKDSRDNKLVREYIKEGSKFYCSLMVSDEYYPGVVKAFKAIEQFGGLGSKSRNGYGCFKIINATVNEIKVIIPELDIKLFQNQLSNYSAFSISTVVKEYKTHENWQDALSELGKLYQQARENHEKWHSYNSRQLIAAPIVVYGKGQVSDLDRHSKPFFMHVKRLENNQFQGSILCMPYLYINSSKRGDYNNTIDKMKQSMNF